MPKIVVVTHEEDCSSECFSQKTFKEKVAKKFASYVFMIRKNGEYRQIFKTSALAELRSGANCIYCFDADEDGEATGEWNAKITLEEIK